MRDCEGIYGYSKLWLAGAFFAAIWSTPILAHDIYANVTDKDGRSCCNNADCRPAQFVVSPKGVTMLVEGDWLRVPADTIVYRTLHGDSGETGGGHWCGSIDRVQDGPGNADPTRVTYCAILPPTLALMRTNGPRR